MRIRDKRHKNNNENKNMHGTLEYHYFIFTKN